MGKKSSNPPNVAGAAQVEGQFSKEVARDTSYADRPDQYGPLGSVTWQQEKYKDPGSGEWTTKWIQNQEMSEDMKGIYDPMVGMMGERADLASGMMGRIENEMGAPPDWNQFGEAQGLEYDPAEMRGRAEDALYNKSAMRLDPRFAREGEALDVKLRNQGLRPGDQAYDSQMESFNFGKNDAYAGARLDSVTGGQSEAAMLYQQQTQSADFANSLRDKNIAEYLAKRGFSLGESNALNPTADVSNLASLVNGGGAPQSGG